VEGIIMKKSLMLVAALAATAFAGSALALDVDTDRELVVLGLTSISGVGTDSLGRAMFTGLGTSGGGVGSSHRYCQYLMEWESPFNPNDVQLCVVREKKTPFAPSCIANRHQDITSFLEAGSDAPSGSTYCAGFDNLGIAYDDVSLLLGEREDGGISGIAVYPTGIPLVLPVEAL
jgi:hypothetical protein